MSTITDPGKRLGLITGYSLVGTVIAWTIFALFTSPILYLAINSSAQMAGLYVLGVFGWGIWFGQQLLSGDVRQEYEEAQGDLEDGNRFLLPLFTLVNLAYYNIVIYATIITSLFIAVNGFPAIAVVFALIYPAYDMAIVYRGYPLSIAGVLAVVIAVGLVLANLRDVSWQEIDFGNVLYRVIGGRRYGFP